MTEDIDEEMIDSIYDSYEDNTPKGPDKKEYPLPPIIKEWVKAGSEYSIHNEFPLKMCYFNIMGQVIKDFVVIPIGANRLDTRFHFVWLQTARTGKSAVWKFMDGTLKKVYKQINALKFNEDNSEIREIIQDNDVFDISVYTSAALIGTFIENSGGTEKYIDTFDDGALIVKVNDDEKPVIYNSETHGELEPYINRRKVFIPGALKGSGIAHWDEFESSGIFNLKKHNEDMLLTFQTFLNDIDTESDGHVMTKYLAGVDHVGKCDSRRSLYATSYVPHNLGEVIRNSGVLQRAFNYINEVPEELINKMHREVIANIGIKTEHKEPMDKFSNHFVGIWQQTLQRYKDVGCDPTAVMVIPKDVVGAIDIAKTRLDNEIATCRPEIKKAVQTFSMNLMLYHVKLATFIAISDGRYVMKIDDVHCAAELVHKTYNSLVVWLERGVKAQRVSLSASAGINEFKQCYFDSNKDTEGYIKKSTFLELFANKTQISPAQTYRKYEIIKSNFEEIKKGRVVYIKYIGD
jgi:hypothetical protein